MTIDVETVQFITKMLMDEIMKYPDRSPESVALWLFKERIANEA